MSDITFFCSPIGLGHATRDIAITAYLNATTNFVTGNAAAEFFKENGFKVQNAYVPPQFIVNDGKLSKSLNWLWKYYKYYKECKIVSRKIISDNSPRIVVSDEDFASLTIAQKNGIPNVLITDILKTNFVRGFGAIIEKKMNSSMSEIIKKCDLVIIPENGDDKDNIKRVGPIVRSIEESREDLRKKFGFNKKTILVCVGGTDAGRFLIEKTIEIMPKFGDDIEFVFVTGPTLKNEFNNLQNLGFVLNLHEYIFASDTVVSLAGKSTIDETKAYGTPGIFIPIKDHFEQEDNAREEGYKFEDVFRLDSIIEKMLNEKRNPMNNDGASKAAKLINEL